uniref:Uncharacterized protein n=1 Tax=Hubei diptera virus 21 TaxID=1922882 RepID=A0A1L3KP63_9VIRU|nr:hypothetical protein 2 [Hubei diptera virus 21]
MDNPVQQLVYEVRQLTNKINGLVSRISSLESKFNEHLIWSSHQNKHTFLPSNLLSRDNKVIDEFKSMMLVKPSREILDDFSYLNDSRVLMTGDRRLSDFETRFELISHPSDIKNVFGISSFEDVSQIDKILLPFIILEKPGDESWEVSLFIHDHMWLNNFRVFLISKDRLLFELTKFEVTFEVLEGMRKYYVKDIVNSTSENLSDFVDRYSSDHYNMFSISLTNTFRVGFLDFDICTLLLVRALIFLRAKDFIFDSVVDFETKDTLSFLQESLRDLSNRTITSGLLEFESGVSLAHCNNNFDLPLGDVGDVGPTSIGKILFSSLPLHGIGVSKSRLDVQLSKLFKRGGIDIPATLLVDGNKMAITLKSVAMFTRIFNLGAGVPSITTKKRRPNNSEFLSDYLVNSFSEYKLKISELHVLEFKLLGAEVCKLSCRDLIWDGEDWSMEITNVKCDQIRVLCGTYEFPPHTISQCVEIFISYSSLLSYTSREPFNIECSMIPSISNNLSGMSIRSNLVIKSGIVSVIEASLEDGVSASLFHIRIPISVVSESIYFSRVEVFEFIEPRNITVDDTSSLLLFLNEARHVSTEWVPRLIEDKDGGLLSKWDGWILLIDSIKLSVLKLPNGFSSFRKQYDFQYFELIALLEGLIFRVGTINDSVISLQLSLQDTNVLVEKLVTAVNGLEKAFNSLSEQLRSASSTPVWKKILTGIAITGGLLASIFMPFALPFALVMLAGSTAINLTLMFIDGDYLAGGVEVAGLLIGLGTGYYATRKATMKGYSVTDLKLNGAIRQEFPPEFDMSLLKVDGVCIEVKPLQMLGAKMEKVGESLMTKSKGVLNSLLKLERAPVHARLRSVTTRTDKNGDVIRTTIISGVTDGMPYMSHINPRPGTYELLERYEKGNFVNGWRKDNVPIGGGYDDLPISIRGLLLEGVGTDAEYKSLIRSWRKMDGDERAMALNDAQSFILRTQPTYLEVDKSRIPISFDESLVRNVSNVFAKHTGIYELTGFTTPGGANNCQTYANELRDFLAKGKLRKGKLSNTTFLNDLMDAFDNSTKFKHTYGPGLTVHKSSTNANSYRPI